MMKVHPLNYVVIRRTCECICLIHNHNPISSVGIHVRTVRLSSLALARDERSMPCVKVYILLGHLCEVRPETM